MNQVELSGRQKLYMFYRLNRIAMIAMATFILIIKCKDTIYNYMFIDFFIQN